MRIRSLQATGWRNLLPLDLAFDEAARLHVFSGDNGQGKTNIIEALFYLAAFRSFRTSRAPDLVQRGSGQTKISVDIETRELGHRIETQLSLAETRINEPQSHHGQRHDHDHDHDHDPGGVSAARSAGEAVTLGSPGLERALRGPVVSRRIAVDGKTVRGVATAFGRLSVVLFVPEDLLLVRAAPAARRRFMDMAISGVEPAYLSEAAVFQKTLRSRNAVLRGPRSSHLPALLDTYDEQIAQAGARIVIRRRQLVQGLACEVDRLFRRLHGDLPVDLAYVSAPSVAQSASEADVATALLLGLGKRRNLDERRGHTTFGPHVDDLELLLGGRPAREHASQGQLRSLVLALKLAELAHIDARRGEPPVLLLDDVPSELDPTRRRYLFETLALLSAQTLVSVADPEVVPPLEARADFRVAGGRVTPLQVFPLQAGV